MLTCAQETVTHRYPLFLAAREYVNPVGDSVPALLSLQQVRQLHSLQVLRQRRVRLASPHHLLPRVRVDHLRVMQHIVNNTTTPVTALCSNFGYTKHDFPTNLFK